MNNIIDKINNEVDIVDIIKDYIPLTKKGRNYFAVCPFHDDHNPSMSVSPEKKIFNCFVCGAKGGAIKFVQDFLHITYSEALQVVANKIGIKLNINSAKKVEQNYDKEYEAYNLSNKFYINNLNTESGLKALEYLNNRKLENDTIKKFGIGLSLGYDKSITKILKNKGFDEELLVNIGLTNKNEYGYSDLFVNRIMFPLFNLDGKIIGYSGRIYDKSDTSKYINTKETYIFKKGLNLYNYHNVKNIIRTAGQVIIMEGFMDVIRSSTVGIDNVVASMGTAITKEQAKLIKSLSNNVIMCFDGDSAGEKATLACGNELNNIGVNPKVVRLEGNLDPDEYILKYGETKFREKINNNISFLDFKIEYYKRDKNLNENEDLALYINQIIEEVNNIDDDILKELTLKKVSKDINVSLDTLLNKMKKEDFIYNNDIIKEPIVIQTKKSNYIPVTNKYIKAEKKLLFYMLHDKEISVKYREHFPFLPTKEYRILSQEIMQFVKKYDIMNISDFLNYIKKYEELVNLAGQILDFRYNVVYKKEEIDDYMKVLNEYAYLNEIERLNELLSSEKNIEKQIQIATKIKELREGVNSHG